MENIFSRTYFRAAAGVATIVHATGLLAVEKTQEIYVILKWRGVESGVYMSCMAVVSGESHEMWAAIVNRTYGIYKNLYI